MSPSQHFPKQCPQKEVTAQRGVQIWGMLFQGVPSWSARLGTTGSFKGLPRELLKELPRCRADVYTQGRVLQSGFACPQPPAPKHPSLFSVTAPDSHHPAVLPVSSLVGVLTTGHASQACRNGPEPCSVLLLCAQWPGCGTHLFTRHGSFFAPQ